MMTMMTGTLCLGIDIALGRERAQKKIAAKDIKSSWTTVTREKTTKMMNLTAKVDRSVSKNWTDGCKKSTRSKKEWKKLTRLG